MRSPFVAACKAALAGALWLIPAIAFAGNPTFDGESSAQLIQTADKSAGSPLTDNVFLSGTSAPLIPAASPSLFQLSNTFTQGSSTTTADASLYQITTATDLAMDLKIGTGVNQTNGEDPFGGASDLTIDINSFWDIGSAFPAAGHVNTLLYQYNVGGVVDTGGSDTFIVNLTYYDIAAAVETKVGSISINQTYTTPGSFSQLFSSSTLINGGHQLPANSTLVLQGTIEFEAVDPFSGSSINLLADSGSDINGSIPIAAGVPLPNSAAMGLTGLALAAAAAWRKRRRALMA